MIRIDALWLAVEPVDMRAGVDRLLARVVQVFGAARAHHGYLFANARSNRIKLLVHDGFGSMSLGQFVSVVRLTRWPTSGRFGGLAALQKLPLRATCGGSAATSGSKGVFLGRGAASPEPSPRKSCY